MRTPLRTLAVLSLASVGFVACDSDDDVPTSDVGSDLADAEDSGDVEADGPHADAADGTGDDATDVADATDASDGSGADTTDTTDAADGSGTACYGEDDGHPVVATPAIYTPRWAFEPWISKDISDRADTLAFVDGFLSRDIPVGVVVLDSPWETNYNTFVPNPSRYGDFEGLVDELGEDGVRVVLWITQMVNSTSFDFEQGGDFYDGPSPNFAEGQACGYFVNDGATYPWWKGEGAGVDFFHPGARRWWHEQQQAVLDAGIAGWKLDFGDSYIPTTEVETFGGTVTHQQYSEEYYRDFWAWGVEQRGIEEFVTMVRPYDESYQFEGRFFARPEHAPVAWVGDNRRDWVGFIDSLDHTFRSALAGYVVIGSDIGGYLDRDDRNIADEIPVSPPTFYAWTAASAFMPFFQLHGRANLEPWNYGDDPEFTVQMYRYWATLHHELVPFFYSLANEAYAGGDNIIRPIGTTPEEWADDWRFQVGDAFLVAPPLSNDWTRDVVLPADATWYDWWNPNTVVSSPDAKVAVDVAFDRIPVYVRGGAIVPMEIDSAVTGLADAWADGALALLTWPDATASSFRAHEPDNTVVEVTTVREGGGVTITLGPIARDVLIRVSQPPAGWAAAIGEIAIVRGIEPVSNGSGAWEDASGLVWIRVPASEGTSTITLYSAT